MVNLRSNDWRSVIIHNARFLAAWAETIAPVMNDAAMELSHKGGRNFSPGGYDSCKLRQLFEKDMLLSLNLGENICLCHGPQYKPGFLFV